MSTYGTAKQVVVPTNNRITTYDFHDGVMMLEDNKVETNIIDAQMWFRGYDVAAALGYSNKANAIAAHVDADYKASLNVLVQKGLPVLSSLPANEAASIWITEAGFFALTMKSKLPAAKPYQRWVFSEVLPSIHRTGHYGLSANMVLIDAYHKIKVVYVGDVGMHDGVQLAKFGYSDDIMTRDGRHRHDFRRFDLKRVIPCINNKEIEAAFKKHPEIQKRRIEKTIHGKKQIELLALTPDFTLRDIEGIFHHVIAHNPPLLIEHIKRKLQVEDKEIKLRRLELKHELDLKRLENQHALDMAKLQLDHRTADNQSHRALHVAESDAQLSEDHGDEHNPVKDFAEEHLVSTASDNDCITQAMAYERFLLVTHEELVKETSLGRNGFYDRLREHLSDRFHKQKRVAGDVMKNVYTRCRLAN